MQRLRRVVLEGDVAATADVAVDVQTARVAPVHLCPLQVVQQVPVVTQCWLERFFSSVDHMDTKAVAILLGLCGSVVIVAVLGGLLLFSSSSPKKKDGDSEVPASAEARWEEAKTDLKSQCDKESAYVGREYADGRWACPSGHPHDTGINWTADDNYASSDSDKFNGWQCAADEACVAYVKSYAQAHPNTRAKATLEDVKKLRARYISCFGGMLGSVWNCGGSPELQDLYNFCGEDVLDKFGKPVLAKAEECVARKLGVALP